MSRIASRIPAGPRLARPPGPGMGRGRLDSLTSLRFGAALLVFVSHASFVAYPLPALAALMDAGRVGVSYFFILSGFVLTWSRRPDDRPGSFYRRRAARILPNHVAAWALAVLTLVAFMPGAFGATRDLASLLLLQAWIPRPGVYYATNPVLWSLSCEAFFYLCFPAISRLVSPLQRPARRALLATLIVTSIAVQIAALQLAPPLREWVAYIAPPVRLLEFVIGMVLALELREGVRLRLGVVPAMALACAAILAVPLFPDPLGRVAVTLIPFAALIAAAAAADVSGAASPLRSRVLVHLGEWSYAFFLLHLLVFRVVWAGAGLARASTPVAAIAVVVTLGLSIGAAAAMHVLLERPAERALRGPGRVRLPVLAPAGRGEGGGRRAV